VGPDAVSGNASFRYSPRMDRNAPCPCGSGRKFKKCHGGAVPPEAATLPHTVRASVLRAEAVMQRNRRITQDIVDWADRRLTPEWMNTAYDAWGLGPDDELPAEEGDLFTTWAVYHFAAKPADGPVAAQWLAAQQARHGARTDADTVALVHAHRAGHVGVWEITDAEPGVGVSMRRRLPEPNTAHDPDTEHYVYESDASHDLAPGQCVLASVLHLDDVHVFGGLHDVPLEQPELDAVLPPLAHDTIISLRQRWFTAAERLFARLDAEDVGPDEDADEARA
jgi:hypothetical protein